MWLSATAVDATLLGSAVAFAIDRPAESVPPIKPIQPNQTVLSPIEPRVFQFDSTGALLRTDLPFPKRSGKVRDVYDLGDRYCIVSTDRISAFDYILPSGIPDKGRILTAMSEFWFAYLTGVEHHWLGGEFPSGLLPSVVDPEPLRGRTMLVRKARVVPFECVVRGYLEGTGLREYQRCGAICGIALPPGLRQCDRLPEPIFTPTTKAESGHDENTTMAEMTAEIGVDLAEQLHDRSLEIFARASEYALSRGIIIADTKFEFGIADDRLILIDEVLTPDSSRFWSADDYCPGEPQKSFDKQYVREWLMGSGWDRQSEPPALPLEIVMQTRAKYAEALQRLTGKPLEGIDSI
ncbi:MAG: phosphoribosylaminoimidazolesuccinocarboxamide synthase [Planctomycetaceae bacterium]